MLKKIATKCSKRRRGGGGKGFLNVVKKTAELVSWGIPNMLELDSSIMRKCFANFCGRDSALVDSQSIFFSLADSQNRWPVSSF